MHDKSYNIFQNFIQKILKLVKMTEILINNEPVQPVAPKKLNLYTLEYNYKVLTFLHARPPHGANGNISECSRVCGVERKLVSKWNQQKANIFASTHKRTSLHVNNKLTLGRWSVMEKKLNEWIEPMRGKGACVTGNAIRAQAPLPLIDFIH